MSLPPEGHMRSITTGDLHAMAAALLPLADQYRAEAARKIIDRARKGDKLRKRLGRIVTGYCDGTLYGATDFPTTRFDPNSTDHLKALHVAIGEIIADREEKQNVSS